MDRTLTMVDRFVPDRTLLLGCRRDAIRQDRRARAAGVHRGRWVDRFASGPIVASGTMAGRSGALPPEFLAAVVGPAMVDSCAWWGPEVPDLASAESAMLGLMADRSGVVDGTRVLDLGGGWGAFALWAVERHAVEVVAVVSSEAQRRWVETRFDRALRAGRVRPGAGLAVEVADPARWEPNGISTAGFAGRFDRVVITELLEELGNWEVMLARVRSWVDVGSLVFVQVAGHVDNTYARGPGRIGTVGRVFASPVVPALDLLPRFDRDLQTVAQWNLPGTHYAKTFDAWRRQLARNREQAIEALRAAGDPDPEATVARWRTSFIAGRELFGHDVGSRWGVAHYLLEPVTP